MLKESYNHTTDPQKACALEISIIRDLFERFDSALDDFRSTLQIAYYDNKCRDQFGADLQHFITYAEKGTICGLDGFSSLFSLYEDFERKAVVITSNWDDATEFDKAWIRKFAPALETALFKQTSILTKRTVTVKKMLEGVQPCKHVRPRGGLKVEFQLSEDGSLKAPVNNTFIIGDDDNSAFPKKSPNNKR